jgi:dTMP kinase
MSLIVIEGADGVGKTTLIEGLVKHYQAQGVQTLATKASGGTELGVELRKLLIEAPEVLCAETEALLFAAGIYQLIVKVITPALNQGLLVFCDRYIYSTLAYQGAGGSLGSVWINQLLEPIKICHPPDLLLYLDLSQQERQLRIDQRGNLDQMESKPPEFWLRVQQEYLALFKEGKVNVRAIDAQLSAKYVLEQSVFEVDRLLLAQ